MADGDHTREQAAAAADDGLDIDRAGDVRAGEEIDRERLAAYLREHLAELADAPGTPGEGQVVVEQFRGGHSNLTYLVRIGDAEYVLRRPPHGTKARTAHDMSREYRVLSALSPHYDKAPRALLYCDDDSVLGAPFYLMERRRGLVIRRALPPPLDGDPAFATRLCEALADALAELHAVDYRAAGLAELGKPEGYVERQITGWTKRYDAARTDDIPDVDRVAAWLESNRPVDGQPALIHNDFKFDNMMLDPDEPTRITGVFDWEMCTLGDARMDLGTTLSYWMQADDPPVLHMLPFGPTAAPGMFTRRQLADRWAERTGADLTHLLFYYCYGLFKTAVVIQQLYYRYANGQTRDARFAPMIEGVRALASLAVRALDRDAL